MVKLEMLVSGLPDFETDHASVNYAAIAKAAGIRAIRIEQPKDIRAGLEDALNQPGPALGELGKDPKALLNPPHIGRRQRAGFGPGGPENGPNRGGGKKLGIAGTKLRK